MEENQEMLDRLRSKSKLNNKGKKILCLKINTTADELQYRKIFETDDDFKYLLNIPMCTICKRSLKDIHKHDIFRHPLMDVLLCKSCWSFYSCGDFSLDEDGEDKYCRWCGQGGKIFLCSSCIYGFCPRCIRRHFGFKKVNEIKDDEDWKCFVCDPEPLWKLRAICYYTVNPSEIPNKKSMICKSTSSSKETKKAPEIEKEKKSTSCKTKILRDIQKRSIETPSSEEMRLSDEMTQRKKRRCSKTVSPCLESSLTNEGKSYARRASRRRTRTTCGTPELARKVLKSELPSGSRKSQIQCTKIKNDKDCDKCNDDSSHSDYVLECSSDTESADESEARNNSDEPLGPVEEKLQDILKIAEVTSEFSLKTCRKKLKKFRDKNYKGTKENILEEVKSIKSVILLLSSSLSTALNITNLLEEKLRGQLEEHENDSMRTGRKNEDSIDMSSLLKMILEFMLKEKIKATYLLEIIDNICNKYHYISISSYSLLSNFLKSLMKKSDINLQSAIEYGIIPKLNTKYIPRPNLKAGFGNCNSHSIIILDNDEKDTSETIQKRGEEMSRKVREDNSPNVSNIDAEHISKEPNESGFGNVSNTGSEDISKKLNEENAEIVSSNDAGQISRETSKSINENVSNNDSEDISKKNQNENVQIFSNNDAENISKEPNESGSGNVSNNDSEDISKESNEKNAEINFGINAENMSKEPNESGFGNVSNTCSENISKKSNEENAGIISNKDTDYISKETSKNINGNVSNNDSEDISKKIQNEKVQIFSNNDAENISKEPNESGSGNVSNNDSEDISKESNEENAEIISNKDTEHISKETDKNTFGNVSKIDSEVISENSNENRSRNPFINKNDLEIISKEPNANRYENYSNNELEVILKDSYKKSFENLFSSDSDSSTDFLYSRFGNDDCNSHENCCMISNKTCSQFEGVCENKNLDNSFLTATGRKVENIELLSSDIDFDPTMLAKIREELLNSESSIESDLSTIESSSSDSFSISNFIVKRPRHHKHKIEGKAKQKAKKNSKSNLSKEERELKRLLDLSTLERKRKVSSISSRAKSADSSDTCSVLRITEKESNIENSSDSMVIDENLKNECSFNISDDTDFSDNSNNDRTVSTEEYLSDEADVSDNSTVSNWDDDDSETVTLINSNVDNIKLEDSNLKTTSSQNEEYNKDKYDETSHPKSSSETNVEENSSHSSEYIYLNKKRNSSWRKDKLLREISEDTNSEEVSPNKKYKGKKIKRKKLNEKKPNYDFSGSDSSIPKKKTGCAGRKPLDSFTSEDTTSSAEVENIPEQSPIKGRRNIKKILNQQSLHLETKQALKIENERKKRVAERNEVYNKLFPNLDDSDSLILDFNPDTKDILLEVPKNLVKNLKPHQKQGVKFMWDCCFESLDKMKSSSGTGCILAHCMGLGKTLQVVTLIYTLLYFELGIKTVLIVCPLNVLNNWLHEFVIWWKDCPREFGVYSIQNVKSKSGRYSKIEKWHTYGGVLILSYNMMRNLDKPVAKKKSKKKKYDFSCFLHDPGPDVVVCDEGHLMKNEDSGLSKCMRKIKTSRRIVLTGTPFQNNLLEYYSMIQFVKPNILGTKMEFMNRFGNPIKNGQFEDSTDSDVALMRARSHVLHKMLDGCIQRFNYNVAIPFLPEKHEYVISIQLTDTQASLYRHYIEKCRQRTSLKNESCSLFRDFTLLHKLWTHPLTLVSCTKNQLINDKFAGSHQLNDELNFPENVDSNDEARNLNLSKTNETFWENEIKPEEYEDYKSSGKLLVLLSLLKYCKDVGDKVLVFSQSLYVLNLIEYFLKKINRSYVENSDDIPVYYRDTWVSGIDYYRLDGSTNSKIRSKFCKAFNKSTNKRGRLFLISTKAGGLGINLVGANRVVIFDVSWNPSYDVQSIFRVYRFGQKKPCYFYRFFAEGTMEEKIYERQVTKLSLEKRVLDEHQIERHYTQRDIHELYRYDPLPKEKWVTPKLPKDVLLAEILNLHKDIIVGYHEHDSLLENKEEEELTEEERKAAWEDFEAEKFWKETKNQKPMNIPNNSNQTDDFKEFWKIVSQLKTNQFLLPLLPENFDNETPSTSMINLMAPKPKTQYQSSSS